MKLEGSIPRHLRRLSVLELGCGTRQNALLEGLRPRKPFVVKLEIDRKSLYELSRLEAGSACFVLADALALPFRDGSFHIVLWRNLLDFIPRIDSRELDVPENIKRIVQGRARFFEGIFRVLLTGGIAISDDIADTDALYRFTGPLGPELRTFARRTDLASAAVAAGFEVIQRNEVSGLSVFKKP